MSNQATAQWADTRVSKRLGIQYPIIQGPLGGLSSQRLTAAVSNYGGLGSFGAHGLTPNAIEEVIAELRSMTSMPFAINLWVSMEDEGARASDEAAFNRSLATLTSLIQLQNPLENAHLFCFKVRRDSAEKRAGIPIESAPRFQWSAPSPLT